MTLAFALCEMGNQCSILSKKMTPTYLSSERIILAVVWRIDLREAEMKQGDLLGSIAVIQGNDSESGLNRRW